MTRTVSTANLAAFAARAARADSHAATKTAIKLVIAIISASIFFLGCIQDQARAHGGPGALWRLYARRRARAMKLALPSPPRPPANAHASGLPAGGHAGKLITSKANPNRECICFGVHAVDQYWLRPVGRAAPRGSGGLGILNI
jgi:hypothetical protein